MCQNSQKFQECKIKRKLEKIGGGGNERKGGKTGQKLKWQKMKKKLLEKRGKNEEKGQKMNKK